MLGNGRDCAWKVMDLTHGRSDGTLNPYPTFTELVTSVLEKFPSDYLPKYSYTWLLPQREQGLAIREVVEDDKSRSLDIFWAEIQQPYAGSFWQEWGIDNPVVELTLAERLFVALAQIVVGKGQPSHRRWAAAQIMEITIIGKRRMSERYPYLVPDKWSPEFEGAEEYVRFLGQPVIDPTSASETVNYLEF